tara:strand:- start:51 stop:1079 length:1029 start_codon:yes stop_codon:yes gene_type:complete
MEKFIPKDGRYEITADQQPALLKQLRETLANNNQSKQGVIHKTKIGDQLHILKNRGNKANPIWNFKPISQLAAEKTRRVNRKTYFNEDSRRAAKSLKFKDKDLAKEADALGIPIYEEHQHSLDAPAEHLPDDVGTDDLGNRKTRLATDKTKQAKDQFDGIAKRNKHPWKSFFNETTDELQVINIEEWKAKGNGRFVDIFRDGITLTPAEVKQWDKVTKTGKLGNFPKEKAAYLLKEVASKTPSKLTKGLKFATAASLLGVGALGTGAAVADTIQRTNKARKTGNRLDKLQAGIAGLSAATGATGIGEIVSTPADLTNLLIDAARYKRKGPMLGSRSRFKLRK